MKISRRAVGAAAIGLALIGGGVLWAADKTATPEVKAPVLNQFNGNPMRALEPMCTYCMNETSACYSYGGAADAGRVMGGCSYPPCPPPMKAPDKLICAACRALCPNTKGHP